MIVDSVDILSVDVDIFIIQIHLLMASRVCWKSAPASSYSLARSLVCSRLTERELLASPSLQLVNLSPAVTTLSSVLPSPLHQSGAGYCTAELLTDY